MVHITISRLKQVKFRCVKLCVSGGEAGRRREGRGGGGAEEEEEEGVEGLLHRPSTHYAEFFICISRRSG